MSKKYKGKLCVYCAKRPSTNQGDHVFAREFFLEHERGELIKVPACTKCNNKKSKIEHYLATVLPFGGRHRDSMNNLSKMAPKRLRKNKRLARELKAGASYIFRDNSKERPERGIAIPFDGDLYAEFFVYAAKALSWKHWGVYLSGDTVVYSTFLTDTGVELFQNQFFTLNSKNRVDVVIGNNTVKYCGVQGVDDAQITIWLFSIYNGLTASNENFIKSSCVGVISGPPAIESKLKIIFNAQ